MAQVLSFLKLRGSMGETTFKKVGKKHFANDKVSISDPRMKFHDKFVSLRRNGSQMGNASKNASLIRSSLARLTHFCKDTKMVGRFNAELMKVLKRDHSNDSASRGMVARAENMDILLGFDFNDKAKLRATFNVSFNMTVDRAAGNVKINIASFKPAAAIKAPKLATQFKIIAQVADLNFDPGIPFNYRGKRIEGFSSGLIQLDNTPTEPMQVEFKINTGDINTVIIGLGVDFNDASNPLYAEKPLSSRVSSACIVGVDKGVVVPFAGVVAAK